MLHKKTHPHKVERRKDTKPAKIVRELSGHDQEIVKLQSKVHKLQKENRDLRKQLVQEINKGVEDINKNFEVVEQPVDEEQKQRHEDGIGLENDGVEDDVLDHDPLT